MLTKEKKEYENNQYISTPLETSLDIFSKPHTISNKVVVEYAKTYYQISKVGTDKYIIRHLHEKVVDGESTLVDYDMDGYKLMYLVKFNERVFQDVFALSLQGYCLDNTYVNASLMSNLDGEINLTLKELMGYALEDEHMYINRPNYLKDTVKIVTMQKVKRHRLL